MPDVLAEIAADFHARLADGGTEPPLRGLKLVRDHRLGAVRLARDLGGAGYTLTEFFDHVIALAADDPDLAHILRIHYSLVEELQVTPKRPGSDRWIGIVAEGGLIGGTNTELSQKSVGGNNRDTRLVSTEGGLRLRGRKFYSTGAQFSDYLRVTAQDDDGAPTAVVIPADRAGVEHADDWDGIGQRQTGSGTTIFEDVVVEADEVFPLGANIGVDRPRGAFLQLYLPPRWCAVGAGRTPLRPPTSRPLTHSCWRSSAKSTRWHTPRRRWSASRIFDAGGASAIQASAVLDRHWRNLRTLFSHNPAVYKARILGDIAVNGVEPPDTSFF